MTASSNNNRNTSLTPGRFQMKAKPLASIVLSASIPLMAACTSQPATGNDADASPPAGMAQSCNADAARGAVGKAATPEVVEQARREAGAAIARVLKPGQVVTMEYRGDRLNVDVDDGNVVTNLRCG
jgi:uncharacterized lipoprotein YajG